MVTTVPCGAGIWLPAYDDVDDFVVPNVPCTSLTLPVLTGWNLLGGPASVIPVDQLIHAGGGAILPVIYRWDANPWSPTYGTYVSARQMVPGGAYWVAALSDATVTLGGCPLAAPPAQVVAKPTWESMIAIETQSQRQELAFGMHASASPGFDKSVDRPSPPVPAWMDSVKAGWIVEDSNFSLLNGSFVGDSAHASWELSIELPESGELQWSDLPTAYRCVLKYDGQVIRMNEERSIYLPAGRHDLTLVLDAFDALPKQTELLANYPNPCNPETWIPYRVAHDGDVTLVIYDMSGRALRRFHLHDQLAGEYKDKGQAIYWDGKNEAGEPVSSGVYFYSLQAAGASQTRKLVIVR
jgi:hypothetical protein